MGPDEAGTGRGQVSAQDTGTSQGQDGLAEEFSHLARNLQQQGDPQTALVEIVKAAVELIPGVDVGSISVVLGRRAVRSEAASDELAEIVDALQEEVGQGPCLDAAYQQETVRVSDMATEQRWPRFAQRALQAGAASMLSFQLYVEGDNLGALNLYSRRQGAFTDESEHVGLMFAAHAAVAYAAARKQSDMVRAVATRELIGQAQGMLMERHRIGADAAFALLVRVSQHRNVKLRAVAELLVRTGVLPHDPAAPRQQAVPVPRPPGVPRAVG